MELFFGLQVPEGDAKPLYLQYAKLEEDYGLARHALAVYDRATKAVPDDEKVNVYEIYIARASAFFGVSRTREIYEVCFWPFALSIKRSRKTSGVQSLLWILSAIL